MKEIWFVDYVSHWKGSSGKFATFERHSYSHSLKTRIFTNDSDHQPSQIFVGDKKQFHQCCLLKLLVCPSHASTLQNTWTRYSENVIEP
jgi:hypothetical protein